MNNLKQMRTVAGFTRTRLSRQSGVSRWRLAMAETEGSSLTALEVEAVRGALSPELVRLAHMVLEFQAAGQ